MNLEYLYQSRLLGIFLLYQPVRLRVGQILRVSGTVKKVRFCETLCTRVPKGAEDDGHIHFHVETPLAPGVITSIDISNFAFRAPRILREF